MNNYEKSDRIADLLLSKAGDSLHELVLPIERGQGDSFVLKNLKGEVLCEISGAEVDQALQTKGKSREEWQALYPGTFGA